MIAAAFLLLWAAATRVELVDQIFEVPPAEWRYVELSLKQRPVTVICQFEASGRDDIRVALLRREDFVRFREDRPHGNIALTPPGSRGDLRYTVHVPGTYYVVVDNRAETGHPAKVHLHISLDFAAAGQPYVRTLSPARQAVVIAISFAVFFGVVLYAGRKLLRGMRR